MDLSGAQPHIRSLQNCLKQEDNAFFQSSFFFYASYFNLRLAIFQAEVLLQETACLGNLDVNHVREAWRREGLRKYLFLFNHEREALKREGLQKCFFLFHNGCLRADDPLLVHRCLS